MPDLTEDYWALRKDAGVVWLPREFVRVSGPDAITFLQGQLSQDLEQLTVGAAAHSFLLQPLRDQGCIADPESRQQTLFLLLDCATASQPPRG